MKVPKIVLLIESSRASGRDLLRGIANYARLHGPWTFYWEPGGLEKVWPHLKTLKADGIILRDVEKVAEVLATGIPAIVVGHSKREIPGLINVITDSVTIGNMAAEHLLNCGFREFAFCGCPGIPWSDLRSNSFRQRITEAECSVHEYKLPVSNGQPTWGRERLYMAKWLERLPKPLGVMACNDDRGRDVIEACKMVGLKVPDEVAIIGADNDELLCELSDPPMSSVGINFERAGYESAQLLATLMTGKPKTGSKIIVHATHVVPRQSTDIVAIGDPALGKALRFIRETAREAVHVEHVVKAAGLSRRVLEKRFRKVLGRSVLEELRRVRVAQICRMLVETNQSVSQIALSLGYADVEHFARYFRKEKKMTPLAYRKRYGHK